jgi:gamma-carbonic anhydrase
LALVLTRLPTPTNPQPQQKTPVTRHRAVANAGASKVPTVAASAFVAPNASVVGEVTVADRASVWYGAHVRGDAHPVSIGAETNLQDGACVGTLSPQGHPTTVGRGVSVGHGAVLRGCTVGDRALIGMNAVVQDGATVETEAMVAAGAVIPEGATVPTGELWGGNPARRLRAMKPEEVRYVQQLPGKYVDLAQQHASVVTYMRERMARMPELVSGVTPTGPASSGAAPAPPK